MCVIEGLSYKCFRRACLAILCILVLILTVLIVLYEHRKNGSNICKDNMSCPAHWICCDMGCCSPVTVSPRIEAVIADQPWYKQWPVIFFEFILAWILIVCFFFCRRNRQSCCGFSLIPCCDGAQHDMEVDSAGSLYPPPRYSRCGSFPHAPPPYSEVQSKPDQYPLVITCAEGDAKHGRGGSYLMVHYFKNRVIRPPQGCLSPTSPAESLNSSLICNTSNESDSVIPPPYPHRSNNLGNGVGGWRSMLRSVSSLNEPRPAHLRTNPSPHRPRPQDRRDVLQWNDLDTVQSKPNPLVYTCAEGDAKHGRGGTYIMGHFFRNSSITRLPQGSVSPTISAESVSSSLICNTSNGVQSKPNPLVYTCAEGDAKHGRGGTYIMGHFFKNSSITRLPQGSVSPTISAESVSSSLICNTSNGVQSKPNPLVYTCAEGDAKHGRGGTYIMGHFFKNSSITRLPQGSVSPTISAESVSSSLICNTSNGDQAYDPTQAHAMRPDRSGCEMYCEYWRHTLSEDTIFEPEAYEERRVIHHFPTEPVDSPPQLTIPEPLKPIEDRRQRCLESTKRNIKKSSLYMPLSTAPVRPSRISPGARASSRSAPATPSTNLVPNLLNFTHRATRYSSRTSRLEEEYDALIMDMEQHADHKF